MSDELAAPVPTAGEDPNGEACRLVGKFLQSFAELEEAIDAGIEKLFRIGPQEAAILGANIAFTKKVDTVFSAENIFGMKPKSERGKLIKQTKSGIFSVNEERKMFAHNKFAAQGKSVVFRRVVANGKLSIRDESRSPEDIEALCKQIQELTVNMNRIVLEMEPYKHTTDFSDPRNAVLIAALGF